MNNIAAIAKLNDDFRANPSLGTFVLTPGIRANSFDDIEVILNKVRHFDDFSEENNPYGEKDFGAFSFKGEKIFWKIDYYDRNFERFFGRLIIMTAILNLLRRMPLTLVRRTVF